SNRDWSSDVCSSDLQLQGRPSVAVSSFEVLKFLDLRPRFEMTAKGPTMEQKPTEDNAKIHQLNALRKHNSDKALTNDSGANAARSEERRVVKECQGR